MITAISITVAMISFFFIFHIKLSSVAGEFIPKSFYIIDQNGHKSDVIELRNRRDLLPILRARRSDNRNTGNGGGNPYNPGSASGNIVFGNIPNFATPGETYTFLIKKACLLKLLLVHLGT